jgi:site-specific recombinase XerD
LDAEDTKSGVPTEFAVPDVLTPYFTRYLEQIRPRLGERGSQALWPSPRSGRLTDRSIHALVCRRTKAAFGVSIHPHLFRDIAATAIARAKPEAEGLARDLLGHSNVETTANYYIQARTGDASRHLAELIEAHRAGSVERS